MRNPHGWLCFRTSVPCVFLHAQTYTTIVHYVHCRYVVVGLGTLKWHVHGCGERLSLCFVLVNLTADNMINWVVNLGDIVTL